MIIKNLFIIVLSCIFLTSIVVADNGVWHRAEDVKPGIFGSDEESGDYSFINSNLGIGTTNPQRSLHISINETGGNQKNQGILLENINPNGNSGILIRSANYGSLRFSDLTKSYTDTANAFLTYNHVNNEFNFLDNEDGTQYPIMTIESNTHNVGIGTTSPKEKLEVNGKFQLTTGTEHGGLGIANNGDLEFYYDQISSNNIGLTINDDNGDVNINKNLKVEKSIKWGYINTLSTNQGGSIELGGSGTPYIDFHNDLDSANDYNMRIVLNNDNQIGINGGVAGSDSFNIQGGNLNLNSGTLKTNKIKSSGSLVITIG